MLKSKFCEKILTDFFSSKQIFNGFLSKADENLNEVDMSWMEDPTLCNHVWSTNFGNLFRQFWQVFDSPDQVFMQEAIFRMIFMESRKRINILGCVTLSLSKDEAQFCLKKTFFKASNSN